MVVYRKSDRIKVKLAGLEIKLAPLTYHDKSEIQNMIQEDAMKGSMHAVKCAVKEISGLKLPDGSDYELSFDGEKLSDDCMDDLTNLQGVTELHIACLDLLNGVPEEFTNPMTGEKLEGIEIVKESKEKPSEKKSGS